MTTQPKLLHRRKGRADGAPDRGAAILEFALISFALFALLFIIIEGAFAVRARSTMANALDDAAREAAVAGSDPDADYLILNQLFGRGAGLVADVEYVVIFRSDSGAGQPTPGCLAGVGETDECNVYPGTTIVDSNQVFRDNPALYGCGVPAGDDWCATDRAQNPTGSLEFIGVYVKADYRSILNGINFTVNVSGQSLQALELVEIGP